MKSFAKDAVTAFGSVAKLFTIFMLGLLAIPIYAAGNTQWPDIYVRLFPVVDRFELNEEASLCIEGDAWLYGYMNKTSGTPEYIVGEQRFSLVFPDNTRKRWFQFEQIDQDPNRPASRDGGLQSWGAWILKGACLTGAKGFETTVKHWVGDPALERDRMIVTTNLGPLDFPWYVPEFD